MLKAGLVSTGVGRVEDAGLLLPSATAPYTCPGKSRSPLASVEDGLTDGVSARRVIADIPPGSPRPLFPWLPSTFLRRGG